jgi:ubiquinol-cytochrome c reductase cytochrome c1 subunit
MILSSVRKYSTFVLILFSTIYAFANQELHLKKMIWPFDGFFGKVDKQSAQRGFQVYKEVCQVCHGLSHLSYRNLMDLGFSEAEVKEIAKNYSVVDGPNDDGEMFERKALPSDKFVSPYKNEKAARASNNGAYPPDLSLIIKARHDGANYVYSLLTGYEEAPSDFKLMPGLNYNKYFQGHQIAMPAPLSDSQVTYQDGTKASVEQMAYDVVNFLQFAAEPEMEKRKAMGTKVMIYLVIFTLLFYFSKKRIWSDLEQ